ncbi:hypothetical protein D3C71_1749910 [compost metagenome]
MCLGLDFGDPRQCPSEVGRTVDRYRFGERGLEQRLYRLAIEPRRCELASVGAENVETGVVTDFGAFELQLSLQRKPVLLKARLRYATLSLRIKPTSDLSQ